MMKNIFLIISILLLLTNCSKNEVCNNRFLFVSCDDSIPILDLNIIKHHDTIRKEMCDLYGFDLCELCTWAEFKIPFQIENKEGHLKVLADFDRPYCENCPVYMRERSYYSILIRKDNKIAIKGKPVLIDSLEANIINYLSKVGIDDTAPENYKKVNFRLVWDKESDQKFINVVLTNLYKAHLSFVEKQIVAKGLDFCDIETNQIKDLKEKYPLRIELDLGKNAKWTISFSEELENIEIDTTIIDIFDNKNLKPKR